LFTIARPVTHPTIRDDRGQSAAVTTTDLTPILRAENTFSPQTTVLHSVQQRLGDTGRSHGPKCNSADSTWLTVNDITTTAARCVSFGQKWKTGTGRQYFTDIMCWLVRCLAELAKKTEPDRPHRKLREPTGRD